MGCFNASLGANDLLRSGRCCRSGGHVAALDVTGLTNLEGSASSSLDDLGERLLAGGTGKLMGRSRCEGSEDGGAWGVVNNASTLYITVEELLSTYVTLMMPRVL